MHLERFAGETLKEIVAALEQRRVEARRRMLEALDSNRYERFVSSFTGTLRRGQALAHRAHPGGRGSRPAPYKKVRKDVKALTELAARGLPRPAEEGQTAALRPRAAAGHLRQTGGEDGRSPQDVQDDLGDNQDLVVAAKSMEELATADKLPPRVVFSLGVRPGATPATRPSSGRASSSPGRSGL